MLVFDCGGGWLVQAGGCWAGRRQRDEGPCIAGFHCHCYVVGQPQARHSRNQCLLPGHQIYHYVPCHRSVWANLEASTQAGTLGTLPARRGLGSDGPVYLVGMPDNDPALAAVSPAAAAKRCALRCIAAELANAMILELALPAAPVLPAVAQQRCAAHVALHASSCSGAVHLQHKYADG